MDKVFGIAIALYYGMETKEREKLIEIHREALEFYLLTPELWRKEIVEKIEMIERLLNDRTRI